MTNGKGVPQHLAMLLRAFITLDPEGARKLAGVIVAAADLAEKGKESDGSEERKEE